MTGNNDSTFFAMKLLEFEDAQDPLLAMLQWMTDQMMELEVEQKCNAAKGSHKSTRRAYRSGYRPRRFDTRLGTLYMLVPKLRNGGYVPFFVTEKKRSEQALIDVVREAWTNGVSTRKIDRLAKAIGIEGISAAQVSNITGELDRQVEEFRNRPLDEEYPVLWVDALYEKIRDNGKVINAAVLVVRAVDLHGMVHIIAVEPMYGESEASYSLLFDKLRKRGLSRDKVCIATAINDVRNVIGKPIGRGNVSSEGLEHAFSSRLDQQSILVTDKSKGGIKYAESTGLAHFALDSRKESRKGPYNLQLVNALHSIISEKSHSRACFATKNAGLYITWEAWKLLNRTKSLAEKKDILKSLVVPGKKTVTMQQIRNWELPPVLLQFPDN